MKRGADDEGGCDKGRGRGRGSGIRSGGECGSRSTTCWRVVIFVLIVLLVATLLCLHPPPVLSSSTIALSTSRQTVSRILSTLATPPAAHHPPPPKLAPSHTTPKITPHQHISTKSPGNLILKLGGGNQPPPPAPKVASTTNFSSTMMSPYNETNILRYALMADRQLQEHIRKAGLRIVHQSPDKTFVSFKIHSARSGSAERLDGIGAKCDWSVTWTGVLYGITATPRIVCVGTKSIEKFWRLVPYLTRSRFILVTGGGDRLQPMGNSEYPAYEGFGGLDGGPGWKMFTESPNILHVFSENHNMNHSRYSTLPCGFPHNKVTTPADLLRSVNRNLKPHIPFEERPIRVLVSDRVRGGPWYEDRILAREYCVNVSSSFCSTKLEIDFPDEGHPGNNSQHSHTRSQSQHLSQAEIGHAKFVWSVQNSQFVSCTHGGGLDPSPKAWETILIGSIPIIQHSTLDDGYLRLPVVIVPNITAFLYNADGQSPSLLDQWLEDLAPHYVEGSALRTEALYRLSHSYWYGVLKDKYDEVGRGINEAIAKGEIPKY